MIEEILRGDPSEEAVRIFNHLCLKYEGTFKEGEPQNLQRRIKVWRHFTLINRKIYIFIELKIRDFAINSEICNH